MDVFQQGSPRDWILVGHASSVAANILILSRDLDGAFRIIGLTNGLEVA